VYEDVLYALGYNTHSLYVYGVQSDGFISPSPLGTYPEQHPDGPFGIAATGEFGEHYVIITDPIDGYDDVYSYGLDGHLVYEGTVDDSDGPYDLVYDPDEDEFFEIRENTSTLAVYGVLDSAPYIGFENQYPVPLEAGYPAVMPLSGNVYIPGSVGSSSSFDFIGYSPGTNNTLNPIGSYTFGTSVSSVVPIGSSGYLLDIDNGGTGSAGQIQLGVWQDHLTGGPTLSQQISLPGATTAACTPGTSAIRCYVAIGNGIAQYRFDDGQLRALSPATITTGTASLTQISIAPSGSFLFAVDSTYHATSYDIRSTGELGSPISSIPNANFVLPLKYSF
jgi:hypothetical protein